MVATLPVTVALSIFATVLFLESPLTSVLARVNDNDPTKESDFSTDGPLLASTAMPSATASCSPPESACTVTSPALETVLSLSHACVPLPITLTATLPATPIVLVAKASLARVMAAAPLAAVMSESETALTTNDAANVEV